VTLSTNLAVGLIAALAVVITGAVSLLAQLIANSNARKTAAADRAAALKADRERRQFEAQERRYEDRREALIGFNAAVLALGRDQRDRQKWGEPGMLSELAFAMDAALVRVRLLCPGSVGSAATALVDACLTPAQSNTDYWHTLREAERDFHTASQGVLLGEVPTDPGTALVS
jgi:hypothetical protein